MPSGYKPTEDRGRGYDRRPEQQRAQAFIEVPEALDPAGAARFGAYDLEHAAGMTPTIATGGRYPGGLTKGRITMSVTSAVRGSSSAEMAMRATSSGCISCSGR
jgi:hypothetical protein